MSSILGETEDVESFRSRARAWLEQNMPRLKEGAPPFNSMNVSADDAIRAKQLQRKLYEGGFAGICFPREYGGLGLSREHQRAFTEESSPYEMPFLFNTPTFTIIAPTLLDFGSEHQKKQHLSAIIRGDELWVQFMSEPSGGSDMAGAITSAKWDGTRYLLNGSKIWSSYAYFSDYALCLARTNWDLPKHRGLTMFIVKIRQPGVTIHQIRQSDGAKEFCQEFFDDVPLQSSDVVGAVDDGWTVAQRLLFHERNSTGGSSPYASGTTGSIRVSIDDLIALAREMKKIDDPRTLQQLAEAHVLQTVQMQLIDRVVKGIALGDMPPEAGSLLRIFGIVYLVYRNSIAFDIGGTEAIAWPNEKRNARDVGNAFIFRQARALGGGSAEIQRNIVSERVLGMPREPAADRDIPFKNVRRNSGAKAADGRGDI